MIILVTGGAGFIGSHLVDQLIRQRHHCVIVDDLSTGKKENINPKTKFYKLKIQDKKLEDVFKKEKPEIVYHLAAQVKVGKSVADPIADANINILGSLNLLNNSVKYKIKKIIFISTGGAIYGDGVKIPTPETALEQPLSPYGIAKLSVEKYLYFYYHTYQLPYTILRLANIYGPRQGSTGEGGVVSVFCRELKENLPLTINGTGQQTRDFVYVADVVKAAIKVIAPKISGIYNIGTGHETDVNTLANQLIAIIGKNVKIKYNLAIPGEQRRSCLSSNKIKQELNWQPEYDLNRGLRETWQYFSRHKIQKTRNK